MIPGFRNAVGLAHSLLEKLVNISDSGGEVNCMGRQEGGEWQMRVAF